MFSRDFDTSLSDCSELNSSDSSNSSTSSDQPTNFEDLTLVKVLCKAKYSVLLGNLPSRNDQVAVKLFPYRSNELDPCFINEVTFANLRHPNIISILHYETEREAVFEDCSKKISYIVMELAPFGDLCEFFMSPYRKLLDETLARTYFHQVIEGLEYLHSMGVAHLDLKPDNLLLGEDYTLKIADFDQAHFKNSNNIISKGTRSYRAPELVNGACQNPEAADIYSAGVILFVLKCRGILPYSENEKINGMDMFCLLVRHPRVFWTKHCELQKKDPSFFNEDFKTLFTDMLSIDPQKRPTIDQIKKSQWYNGPVYSDDEVKILMKNYIRPRTTICILPSHDGP